MSLTDVQVAAAAADLFSAEVSGTQIGLLSLRHPELDMDDAYRIQAELVSQKIQSGRTVVGWKIGLTSKAMQQVLNIDIPDSGVLLDDMLFDNGATVPVNRFIQPRIEAEIAFLMKNSLGGDNITRNDVILATESVVPSIEILDTRIVRIDAATAQTRSVSDTISDNAANAGVVMGDVRHAINDQDLRWVGAIASRDGEVIETGLGAGVLNDPVESVVWLARLLAQYGQTIEAGQVILSGSFIRPLECSPGCKIHVDFGSFGSVQINFG